MKKIAISVLERAAAVLSELNGMHFPEKYTWRDKFDMLFQRYERGTTILCKKIIKPGMNVIDIGAHIGYYSILFSKLVGRDGKVFAFEPEPKNFELLKKNTQRYSNIKIIQKAISDKSGFIEFYKSKGKTGCHSILPANFREEKIKVQSITLDLFITEIKSPRIDLIKMDIEGAEPRALRGMKTLLKANENIALISEFSPHGLSYSETSPRQFLEDLSQLGMKIYSINARGKTELARFDNFERIKGSLNIFCKK